MHHGQAGGLRAGIFGAVLYFLIALYSLLVISTGDTSHSELPVHLLKSEAIPAMPFRGVILPALENKADCQPKSN